MRLVLPCAMAGAVVVATTAACGDDASDYSDQELLSIYMSNVDQVASVEEGIERLVNLCLVDLGLQSEYLPGVTETEPSEDANDYLTSLRDRVSMEEALESGYAERYPDFYFVEHFDPDGAEQDSTAAEIEQLVGSIGWDADYAIELIEDGWVSEESIEASGLDPEVLDAFLRDNSGGCDGLARDRAFGDRKSEWNEAVAAATHGISPQDDYEFRALEQDWIACMKNQGQEDVNGYYYVFSLQSRHAMGEIATEEFDELQKALAVADATCAEELDLNRQHREIAYRLLRERVEENEDQYFGFQELAEEFNVRIQDLIQEGTLLYA